MSWGVRFFAVCMLGVLALAEDDDGENKCRQCKVALPLEKLEKTVFWGTETFCSQDCKDKFWAAYQDKQWRCTQCNRKVRDARQRGVVEKDGEVAEWDGFCVRCRIKNALKPKVGVSPAAGPGNATTATPAPAAKPRRRIKPAPPPDEGGGLPSLTVLLIGGLSVLIGVRFYQAKKAKS